jgi:predicted small lipoprotein YifL
LAVICYGAARNLEPVVTRFPLIYLAVAGAIAALLSGCGRKGPLDPPPGAWVTPPGGVSHTRAAPAPPATQEYGPDGRPIAPAGPQRSIPADWLID